MLFVCHCEHKYSEIKKYKAKPKFSLKLPRNLWWSAGVFCTLFLLLLLFSRFYKV